MEASLSAKLLNEEEMRLEKDFYVALERFGVDMRHIENYKAQETVIAPSSHFWKGTNGFDFRKLLPEEKDMLQFESDVFLRCVELEEELANTSDPQLNKINQEELEEFKRQFEQVQQSRKRRLQLKEWNDWE